VVDFCAGGGGKTLALAQQMRGEGRLVACDVEVKRIDAIRPRLARAGRAADLRVLGPDGEGVEDLTDAAHLVFVDAPCSGSGTWRRRPEQAWRLTAEEVERLHELQVAILGRAAKLVRPGGRLAYVTCSVLGRENEDSAAAFADAHPGFRPVPVAGALDTPDLTDAARARLAELADGGHMLQLTPRRTNTDGFFVALFERVG
jgi:16S rRNA (cytosine967-C5)-methyltransferase